MKPRERAEALFTAERLGETWWRIYDARGWHVATAPGEAEAMMLVADLAAPIAAAIESAIAVQAAGEAERVAAAVAAEREACAVLCETWTDVYPGASYARGCAARIRARATSPEPEPCVAPGHPRCSASAPCSWCRDAGASPAPEPVAAERAAADRAHGRHLHAALALREAVDTTEPRRAPCSCESCRSAADERADAVAYVRARGHGGRVERARVADAIEQGAHVGAAKVRP